MGWLAEHFELARHGGRKHVLSMEGVRGFAVFLVFLVHYVSLISPWLRSGTGIAGFAEAVHTVGNAGVDLFFVLSGYLIYGSLIRRATPFLPYMGQRLRRIYPAFTVVFVLYVALSLAMPSQSKIPTSGFNAIVYLLANFMLLPGLFPIDAMITVAWSLSYEMFYYLVLPGLILALGLRRWPAQRRVIMFALAGVGLMLAGILIGGPVRMIMFIGGILMYEALDAARLRAPRASLTVLILLGGLGATLLPLTGAAGAVAHSLILAVAFTVLCFSCLRDADGKVARAFTWTPARWLGNMSYSYYLLHGLALKAGFIVIAKLLPATHHDALFFFGMLVPMFLLTLLPTALLFLVIERPFSLARKQHAAAKADLLPASRAG